MATNDVPAMSAALEGLFLTWPMVEEPEE